MGKRFALTVAAVVTVVGGIYFLPATPAPRPDSTPRALSRSVTSPVPAGTTTTRTTAAARSSPSPAPASVPAPKTTPRPAPPPVALPRAAPPPVAPPPVAPPRAAPKLVAPQPVVPPVAPKPVAPPDFGVPVTVGNATQMVTVAASSASATSGTLTAWQKQSNGSWRKMFGPVPAHLGSDGIGTPSESSSRTPRGTWGLTQGFGRAADPGTSMPYSQVGTQDWWVSDVRSPKYNTHQICSADSCGFSTSASENLYYAGPVYDYAMVMDVNRWPSAPGGGSAFFLHVTDGGPTAGCVSVDEATLVSILRWLQPGAHPKIAVGVGRPVSGPRV